MSGEPRTSPYTPRQLADALGPAVALSRRLAAAPASVPLPQVLADAGCDVVEIRRQVRESLVELRESVFKVLLA